MNMLPSRIAPIFVILVTIAPAADLPVREVILYKSGVGYFARSGQLAAGESARLDFKATDMNDVLKSLTVGDDSGAPIRGLRYDSSLPLEQKLAEFPFTVANGQQLSAFLDQLRGARIEMKSAAETLAGTIISARTINDGEKQPEREQLTLLLDSGDLRTVDLGAVSSLRFPDPKLQAQLKDYLAAVAQSRSKDKRSVYIDSANAKARDLSASYMIPQPLWKSSYRLLFDEKGAATLEGWAIVDNTTDDDWNSVRLAVVSGRPVSFISRLYEPFYVQRTTADVENAYAQAPVVYEGDVSGVPSAGLTLNEQMGLSTKNEQFTRSDGTHLGSGSGGGVGGGVYRMRAAPSSVTAQTEARELGDLFEYRFDTPITIRKNESAMLPFLQQKIAVRKLLIYSEACGQNPMTAAELTNDTGKTLDGGPITVFESAGYGGEALMNTVKNGDKRLISYAVDLGTRIGTKEESGDARLIEVHASHGIVTRRSSAHNVKTYTIHNVDSRPRTLIVEQPIREGYELLSPKPSETTANARRFEVQLAAGATVKFPVAEQGFEKQTYAVSSVTPDLVGTYVSAGAISEDGRKQLQRVLDQKRSITETDASLTEARSDMNEVTRAQERLRQNIQTLNRVSGQQEQVQEWSKQLAAEEVRMTALRDQVAGLDKKKAALQSALGDMIEKLEF
jgi:hypothetical protein